MKFITFTKNIIRSIRLRKRDLYLRKLVERGLSLGDDVEIIDTFFFDPSHCFLISIGDNCTICPNVRLIAHDASTKKTLGYTKIGKITIQENCFIGDSTIILPGVTVGSNTIIGAGSVVTKSIPAYSVATGNPATVICTLDEYLNKIKALRGSRTVFSEEYWINNLDVQKRKEITESIGDTLSFIV